MVFPETRLIVRLAAIAGERLSQSPQEQAAVWQEIGDLEDRLEAWESSGELFDLDADEFEDLGVRVIKLVRATFWGGRQRIHS